MRFYLAKDKNVEFSRANSQLEVARQIAVIGHDGEPFYLHVAARNEPISPETCQLRDTVTALIPMMSEQRNGNGFWNIKTVDKCGTLLMNELMKKSSNCNRLDASISLSYAYKQGIFSFSVAIQKCDMLRDIFNTCGEKAKVILEMYFKLPFTGEPTLAGLVTPEMRIISQKDEFICKAPDVCVTDTMGNFWKKNTAAFGTSTRCYPQISASCNVVLIVSDDLPLFQMVRSSDTTRRILEEAIHSDFEIVASDGAVVKCHRSFLAVHSPVLERMLESDMTESTSKRLKVKDMDKSVVVAFLQYLYCKDLPANDLSLTLQLLQVAHKYEIDQLEQATLELLVQKQDVYFTAEFAWEVYVFVRNIPNGNDLKEKVMKIIMGESAVLNVEYVRLMSQDGTAANELMQWILKKMEDGPDGVECK